MNITRAYKTELALNDQQITACKQHAGAARWAYNWGLREKQARYKATGTSPYAMELHRALNVLKQTGVPWMYAVSKCAPREAVQPGQRVCSLLPALPIEERRQTAREGRLPAIEEQEEGAGQFSADWLDRDFPQAIQLPRLGRLRLKEKNSPFDQGGQDSLSYGF